MRPGPHCLCQAHQEPCEDPCPFGKGSRGNYRIRFLLFYSISPYLANGNKFYIPILHHFQIVVELFGDQEFLPHQGFMNIFRKIVCRNEPIGEAICENIVFLMSGFDRAQLNQVMTS